MKQIDKNNWCINLHEEKLTEDQMKVIYNYLSSNFIRGRYWSSNFDDLMSDILSEFGFNWDLFGVNDGVYTIECSNCNMNLNVPKITYNDFEKSILSEGATQ